MSLKDAMGHLTSRVMGIDLHPVAVALARVTYLLALGRERLNAPDRGSLSVPVYLGDSLGWDQREDLISLDHLVIPTDVGDQLASEALRFPEHLLDNSAVFDDLVESLVDESGRAAGKSTKRLSEGTIRRLALAEADLPTMHANFLRLKQLHEAQRNHIWSYYIRNVSRPAWLARQENRVDILVGNPPWLSYRHMTETMQRRFKTLAQDRDFWHNETTATHQDLAGLFVARATERYLNSGGRFAFVVPNSVIDRDYWSGFRRGRFDGANVTFGPSWDLRRIRPHLFPRGSAVVFATRGPKPEHMPQTALIWTGRAPHRHASSDTAHQLHHAVGNLSVITSDDERSSPYSRRFSQGANLVPRLMFRVEEIPAGALGVPAGRARVRSKRSVSEKRPWKGLPGLTGAVETEFVWPTILGEHILPFRVQQPDSFVVPLTRKGDVLGGDSPRIDAYPGLADWIRKAEALWTTHGGSKMTLAQQIDHMKKLSQQLPIPGTRIAYAASGMHVSAALVTDPRVIIEHAVYWAAVTSPAEGRFLVGILNSPVLTEQVRPLMSYGKDERHIDKHVWKLPIPTYDPANDLHVEIARLAETLTAEIAEMRFRSTNFTVIRRDLRAHLLSSDAGRQLNSHVATLLDLAETSDPGATTAQQATPDDLLIRLTAGPLGLPAADVEIDVDCEFDKAGTVYLWGASVTRDGHTTYHSFGSPSGDLDERAVADQFASWLNALIDAETSQAKSVVWYHYGHVEPAHLRRLVSPELAEALLARATDLLGEIIRPNFYGPTGYGLKHLAPAAGATWRTHGATGADTTHWIEEVRAGDADAWQQLLDYNQDDTNATRILRAALASTAQPGSTL